MAHPSDLSAQALALLRQHLAALALLNGESSGTPTGDSREAYRELARAGLMGACHTFTGGPESLYRITEEAYNRREEFLAVQRWRFTPSATLFRIRRAFSEMSKRVSATRSTT